MVVRKKIPVTIRDQYTSTVLIKAYPMGTSLFGMQRYL
jgi:hypothetical protein